MPGKTVQKKGRRKIHKTEESLDGKGNVEQDRAANENKKRKIQDHDADKSVTKEGDAAAVEKAPVKPEHEDIKHGQDSVDEAPDTLEKSLNAMTDKKQTKTQENELQIRDVDMTPLCDDQNTSLTESIMVPPTEGQGHISVVQGQVLTDPEGHLHNVSARLDTVTAKSDVDITDTFADANEKKKRNEEIEIKDQDKVIDGVTQGNKNDVSISESQTPVHQRNKTEENKDKSPDSSKSQELFEKEQVISNVPINDVDGVIKDEGTSKLMELEQDKRTGVETDSKQENIQSSLNVKELQMNLTAPTDVCQPFIDTAECQGQADKVKVILKDNHEKVMTSPDLPVGGVMTDDDNKTEDITDSQLCALEWMSQFPEEISSAVPDKVSMDIDRSDHMNSGCAQIEDGSAIMAGFIRELSQLNKMLLKTRREMETARRQRKTASSK